MSTRRFKGFAFRGGPTGKEWLCIEGKNRASWSPTPTPTSSRLILTPHTAYLKEAYGLSKPGGFPVRKVVRLFAVRKPVVVPPTITTEEQARAFNALEPKASPVEERELYAVLVTRLPAPNRLVGAFVPVSDLGDVGSKEAAVRTLGEMRGTLPEETARVVRVFSEGAHERAIAQAATAERSRLAVKLITAVEIEKAKLGEVSAYTFGLDWAVKLLVDNEEKATKESGK